MAMSNGSVLVSPLQAYQRSSDEAVSAGAAAGASRRRNDGDAYLAEPVGPLRTSGRLGRASKSAAGR